VLCTIEPLFYFILFLFLFISANFSVVAELYGRVVTIVGASNVIST